MSTDFRLQSDPITSTDPPTAAKVSDVSEVATDIYVDFMADGSSAGGADVPIPLPPLLLRRSGIYRLNRPFPGPPIPPIPSVDASFQQVGQATRGTPASDGGETQVDSEQTGAGPITPLPPLFGTEELRVDVDGVMPTMTVSGTISRLFGGRLTWIARVTKHPVTGEWTGPINYRDGTISLRPQATVSVKLTGGPFLPLSRRATARFSGGPGPTVTLNYTFAEAAFRDVAFEYDTVSDATAVTSHNPSSHPNHPASAPNTTLTLESAYARVGIRVTKIGGDSLIPIGAAGANTTWSDQEMHDAMQAHWSRWADAPQWAVWVLFARLHDRGSSLGGIMFDDIGTAQRQGTSIFSDSFISQPPAGEANPGPWVERMKFWTAMHEIGHAFNLAHSWQKSVGTGWVPLSDEPSALSYMNYPFFYPGGLDVFFAAFEYGFSPDELLFLRHAPERLVKMGAEPWFSNHGFERDTFDQLRAAVTGPLELVIRVHREPRFEFLEPVVVELRLKNVSSTPAVVEANALENDDLGIVVAKDGGETRRWLPFARYCMAPEPKVLQPGEAIYSSIFLSAGTGGWLISDPGNYQIFAAADLGNENSALSKPLRIVVERPATAKAERLAGDVFTKDVAHTLAFGGTRELHTANKALEQVVEQLPNSKAAVHATAVLGTPMVRDGKVLKVTESGEEMIEVVEASPSGARERLSAALGDFDRAADSLGHIAVAEKTMLLADVMAAEGDTSARADLLNGSADTLARRGVLPGVVEALRQQ
jgi:hypothetical protein